MEHDFPQHVHQYPVEFRCWNKSFQAIWTGLFVLGPICHAFRAGELIAFAAFNHVQIDHIQANYAGEVCGQLLI